MTGEKGEKVANNHPTKGTAPFLAPPNGQMARAANHPILPNNMYGHVEDNGDIIMSFRISSDVVKRLKSRAGAAPVDRYIYENIVYRAVVDHVY